MMGGTNLVPTTQTPIKIWGAITPFTRAKKIGPAHQIFGTELTIERHGTPNFPMCKGIGPKCNVAPVLKILGVTRLPPGNG